MNKVTIHDVNNFIGGLILVLLAKIGILQMLPSEISTLIIGGYFFYMAGVICGKITKGVMGIS